jgi:carboxylesterase
MCRGDILTNLLHENAKEFYFPGSETGILLIHDFTSLPAEMWYLGDFLKEKGFSVKGVLLKGHGTTPKEMKATNHFDWIESAEEAYLELAEQCKEIFIAGFSMGGAIGLHLANKYDIAGIISLSTPIRINSRQYCKAFLLKHLGFVPGKNARLTAGQRDSAAMHYDKTYVKSIVNLLQLINLVKGSLHRMDKPILIMQSYGDGTVHPSSANFIYKRVASVDKSIVFLHKSGHIITCDCEKEQVFEEVFNFISKRCKLRKESQGSAYSESMEV